MTLNNFFHKTKVDMTANQVYQVPILEDEKRQLNNNPFNFLVLKNNTDNEIFLQLNNSEQERFPIGASDRLIINKEDLILFHSLQLVELGGNVVTGTIYMTMGYLPEEK